MRLVWLCGVVSLAAFNLVGCGSTGGNLSATDYNPGYGPFDAQGNYREDWADKPATSHHWGGTSTPAKVAKVTKRIPTKPAPTIAANTPPSRPPIPAPVVRPTYSAPRPTPAPQPVASTPRPSPPKPTVSTPPPKPKPVVVKPAAPPPRRHVVKAGDTLYSLSRTYGTTVSAIQKANGLSGTTIITGRSIVIPR